MGLPSSRLRPAPHGSRIKSGMTGFWVVIPAGSQPPHCHPGRGEAESRDPWVPGRPQKFVASPSPLWIPDQVRDDGIPGCHPGRSAAPSLSSRPQRSGEPGSMGARQAPNVRGFAKPLWIPDQVRDDGIRLSSRPEAKPPARHPGRSEAESRDPWVPGRPPKFVASPSPLWIPDQVRDDGILGCHPGRSAAPSLSSRPQRSGEPGSTPGLPGPQGSWLRPTLHGSRIKCGMTVSPRAIPAGAGKRLFAALFVLRQPDCAGFMPYP
jgi:hypothetical protein